MRERTGLVNRDDLVIVISNFIELSDVIDADVAATLDDEDDVDVLTQQQDHTNNDHNPVESASCVVTTKKKQKKVFKNITNATAKKPMACKYCAAGDIATQANAHTHQKSTFGGRGGIGEKDYAAPMRELDSTHK